MKKQKMMDRFNLNGDVAIITGTSKGLGMAMAEGLLEAGAKVIAFDRTDSEHLHRYAKDIGQTFKRIQVDLLKTNHTELASLVESVIDEFGTVDILVNNAGISRRGEVEEFQVDDWDDVLNVNLNVPFYLSKILSKTFIEKKKGKIINIASMLSYQGGVRVPAYAASKHGIVGLTKSFAIGLAKYGVNVNAIAPGFMKTDLTQPLQDDQTRNEMILKRIPSERWGEGDDLKGIVVFLASSLSDYIQGTVIPVDGGWLSR